MKLKNGIVAFITVLLATDCLGRAIFEEIRPLVARNRFKSKPDRSLSLAFRKSSNHPLEEENPDSPVNVEHVNEDITPITEISAQDAENRSQGSQSVQAHPADSNNIQSMRENQESHPTDKLNSSRDLTEGPNASSNDNSETHNTKPDMQKNPIQVEAHEKSDSTQNSSQTQSSSSSNVDHQNDKGSQTQEREAHQHRNHEHESPKDEPNVKEAASQDYSNNEIDLSPKDVPKAIQDEHQNSEPKVNVNLAPEPIDVAKTEDTHQTSSESQVVKPKEDEVVSPIVVSQPEKVAHQEDKVDNNINEHIKYLVPPADETKESSHDLKSEPEFIKVEEEVVEKVEKKPNHHTIVTSQNSNEKEAPASEHVGQVQVTEDKIRDDANQAKDNSLLKKTTIEEHDSPIEKVGIRLQEVKLSQDQTHQSEISVNEENARETPSTTQSDHAIKSVDEIDTSEPVIKVEQIQQHSILDEKQHEHKSSLLDDYSNNISMDKPCRAQKKEESDHRMSELFEIKIYVNNKLVRFGV